MSETSALTALDNLLQAEMRIAESALTHGSGYVHGLGIALERESGAPWARHLTVPSRSQDVNARANAEAALDALRRSSNSTRFYGDLAGAKSPGSQYIIVDTRSDLLPRLIVWCNQDRASSSGFTPSLLREFASRSGFVVRRETASAGLALLLLEASENLLLDEVCRLICTIDPALNNSAILWRYDSGRKRFSSIAMYGVTHRSHFDMPISSPSTQGVAHGVVSLTRPEIPYLLYDSANQSEWFPRGIRKWEVRNSDTWRQNNWRSMIVYPLTGSGLLSGAVSIYSRGAGRTLRERNQGLAPLLRSSLQGALRALDESNRLEIMERRFDEQLEQSAISLKVVAHAHDLGHTVDSLKKSLETMRSFSGLPVTISQELEAATQNVNRVRELARLITDPAKPEQRTKRSRCDVGKVVREFEDYLQHVVRWIGDDKVRLHITVADVQRGYTYRCAIDPLKLERLLDNLVNNAVHWCKHAKPQGEVVLRVSPAPVSGESEGVLLEVEDNGTGIPEKDRPFVFDRFYTTRDEGNSSGMGLGLYLSRKSVLEAGGRISVTSQPGRTIFRVLLPVESSTKGSA